MRGAKAKGEEWWKENTRDSKYGTAQEWENKENIEEEGSKGEGKKKRGQKNTKQKYRDEW